MSPILISIIVIGLILAWLWITYNSLVSARLRTDEAWSDISVQLKRRYDLIPNLVNTVKAYATHEAKVFAEVTEARANSINASSVAQKADAENMLTDALKSLFAVAEAYPELKASENFAQLQDELTDTEDKIQAARRFYNGNVRDYNIKLHVFPTNQFARFFGFTPRDFFSPDEAEAEAVKKPVNVQF
jgi:LemA protein